MIDPVDLARIDFEKMLSEKGWRRIEKIDGEYTNSTIIWMWISFLRGARFAVDNGYKSSVDNTKV